MRLAPTIASVVVVTLVLAAPVSASTQTYHATFVEIGGDTGTSSCGSATISRLGHVAYQCIEFDACGPNCHVRTIEFDDGSTLVIHESVKGVIAHGNSAGFLEISQDIVDGTGRFEGATGSGTGVVSLNAGAVIIASGTLTLPSSPLEGSFAAYFTQPEDFMRSSGRDSCVRVRPRNTAVCLALSYSARNAEMTSMRNA
jgi:hypothetical protein